MRSSGPSDRRSLLGTVDHDPYGYYEALRKEDHLVWDDGLKAMVASTYRAVREIQRADDDRFVRADRFRGGEIYLRIVGRSHIGSILGDDHVRWHRWWLRAFSPKQIEEWRDSLIGPIADSAIDAFAERGRADLFDDYSKRVSIRAIAATMDLPWQDEGWISECGRLLGEIQAFIDTFSFRFDGAIADRALIARHAFCELLRPYAEARRSGHGHDILSLLWRDGPSLLQDWDIEDVYTNARTIFSAGTNTARDSIANALYLLLTRPSVAEVLREEGRFANFVEEALRIYGTIHFRTRIATSDTTVAGVGIPKGQVVVTLNASADRDEAQYRCPADIDLHRAAPRDHLAFNVGPRTCVGAAFARAEIQIAIARLLQRLPDIRLDPEAPPPALRGFDGRYYAPLNVLFSSAPRTGPRLPGYRPR